MVLPSFPFSWCRGVFLIAYCPLAFPSTYLSLLRGLGCKIWIYHACNVELLVRKSFHLQKKIVFNPSGENKYLLTEDLGGAYQCSSRSPMTYPASYCRACLVQGPSNYRVQSALFMEIFKVYSICYPHSWTTTSLSDGDF